jgi:hypothetical protein
VFAREAQMLPPLAAAAGALCAGLGGAPEVFFEVPLAAGVPDMVVVSFAAEAVRKRLRAGLGPVVDVSAVRTLFSLAAGTTDVRDLAEAAGVSPGYLRRGVLPALAAAGWVQHPTGGTVQVRHVFAPVVSWAVTVEAKRTAWARAAAQVPLRLPAADRVFVALDAAYARRAVANADHLAGTGVGVVTVSAESDRRGAVVDVAAYPKPNRPRLPRKHRGTSPAAKALLGERVWELQLAGQRHGPTYPVFGRALT